MQWLKVAFSQTWFCGNPQLTDDQAQAQAQLWASNFGPGFSTGLLTIASGITLLPRKGTLYVQAPDNVTPDTFSFLATNWSHDCISVDGITVSDGPPDAATEQSNVDNDHPGIIATVEDAIKAIGSDLLIAGVVLLAVVLIVEFKGGTKSWL